MINIRFEKKLPKTPDILVLPVYAAENIVCDFEALDTGLQELVNDILAKSQNFAAKPAQMVTIPLGAKFSASSVVVIGLGKDDDLNALKAEEIGGKLYAAIKNTGQNAVLLADGIDAKKASHIAAGLSLRSYSFEKYKSQNQGGGDGDEEVSKSAGKIEEISIVSLNSKDIETHFTAQKAVIEGVVWARNLVNEPPNVLYPEMFAQWIKDDLKPLGVQVEILDAKKMEKLRMGAALAVGQGSARPPCMVVMRWNGLDKKSSKDSQPIAFVGKGVTFDTGGISLKPGASMDEMKMDMGGAAAVVGLMKALAGRNSKSDVVAIVGLAENMPSDKAYRPGDILTSYAKKTIEVLNTDAEGRLVLVDAIGYVQDTYKPHTVIDLATLTGAMMVALGHEYCGSFVNDDDLWSQMETASKTSGEKLWRMPLDEFWHKDVQSDVADLRNLGKSGRYGGACSAAAFLGHFIHDGVKWAHMDIAGTAWVKSDKPTVPKYGTGFGVRVLNQLVADHYENG